MGQPGTRTGPSAIAPAAGPPRSPASTVVAVTAALALGLGLGGCISPASVTDATAATAASSTRTPSSTASSGSTSSAPGTPISAPSTDASGAVHGLPSVGDYPVVVAASDPAWVTGEAEAGAVSYHDAAGSLVISIHAVHTVAGVPHDEVPADVAAFLREQRPGLAITQVRSVVHSGRPAQRFRVAMRPGHRPSDLWSVGASGFKRLDSSPMEVVSVRSSRGLLWLWTEFAPQFEEAALARFDAGLSKVTVG